MDYEKKYKDALERMKSRAKGEHPECFSEAQKTIENMNYDLSKPLAIIHFTKFRY